MTGRTPEEARENYMAFRAIWNAENVIKSDEYLGEYMRTKDLFFWELNNLHEIIEIAKQLDEFDFDLFPPTTDYDKEYLYFIKSQNWLNLQNAVLIITRLTSDKNGFTLFKFRDALCSKWIKEEYKEELARRLKSYKKHPIATSEKLIELRNKWLAHIDQEVANGNFEHPKLEIEELKAIYEELMRFFELLTFDTALNTYNTQNIKFLKNRLDGVALKSEVVHLPESNPQAWKKLKRKLSKDTGKLIKFNRFRGRAKLPCIWQLEL
jgi:hypothetical protein